MADEPGVTPTDAPSDNTPDPEVENPRKVVQMSCRMPHCDTKEHFEVAGSGGSPQRVYECCGCGNVWSTNLGGNPGF